MHSVPEISSYAARLVFGKTWMFKHTTSLYHPQSNGKAENAVKTIKRVFTKSRESGQLEFLALLDWHNTLSEGIGLSPMQRLMGHRCKTLLPFADTLLQPCYSTEHKNSPTYSTCLYLVLQEIVSRFCKPHWHMYSHHFVT